MNYEFTFLSYVQYFAGLTAIIIALIIWKKKFSHGVNYLAFFELSAAIWAISEGFFLAAKHFEMKLLWSQVEYIGVTTSNVFYLMFALVYTGKTKFVNRKTFIALMVIPLLTTILAFTNSNHHILWSEIIYDPESNKTIFNYGYWFWLHLVFVYATLTLAIFLLFLNALKVYKPHKRNTWFLLVGSAVPIFANLIYVFKLHYLEGLDLTPLSFVFSGIIILIGFFRLRLFDIIPVASKQVIDNLSVGILVGDSSDSIVASNPSFLNISLFNEKQITGLPITEVLSALNISIEDFSEKNDFTIETKISQKYVSKYYEVKYHNVKDKKNHELCKIFVFNDITNRKIALELISASDNLNKTELAKKSLQIEDLDAFARSVAHDLKSPVNTLIGISELIVSALEEDKREKAIEFLKMIRNDSLKLNRIIDDLLKISVVKKEDFNTIPVETSKIIRNVIITLDKQIKSSNARIIFPENWPEVLAHPQLLEEVWINLISNAIKYGGKPPVVTLGYDVDSDFITFWIEDNGDGLSEESINKIFSDYERLGNKEVEGYGLGLSIVKRIIEKFDGKISVSSQNLPGKGSKFFFKLHSAGKNLHGFNESIVNEA